MPYMERIWRLRVKESIEYFLQIYKYEKLTLSLQQWSTISKTKHINDSLFSRQNMDNDNEKELELDESSSSIRYIGNNLAIISINETNVNVEINIVGPNHEVDKFIVKIKEQQAKEEDWTMWLSWQRANDRNKVMKSDTSRILSVSSATRWDIIRVTVL